MFPNTHTLTDEQEEGGKGGSSGSGAVRVDLLATGICVSVLLLGVVTLIGIATYAYKQKHKTRQRR